MKKKNGALRKKARRQERRQKQYSPRVIYALAAFALFCFVAYQAWYWLYDPRERATAKMEVDVVYTWVDSTDPAWIAQFNKYIEGTPENKDVSSKRYNTESLAEVMLSIESVRKNLPWVQNIYVVAARPQALPSPFMHKHGVRMVYHDEIFPDKTELPVFSSCAIETCLHRIKGLGERFLYFNDDTYINKPMAYSDFYHGGAPIFRFGNVNSDQNSKHVFNRIVYNTLITANQKEKEIPIHHAQPLTKTIMFAAEHTYYEQWRKTRVTKFRTDKVIIPVYLALLLARKKGQVVAKKKDEKIKWVYLDGTSWTKQTERPEHMLCLNSGNKEQVQTLRKILKL